MSKRQMLRALVNARLNAAAEEIFALFERTITEYEEELSRSKENQRYHHVLQDTADVHAGSISLNYVGLNREITPIQSGMVKEHPVGLRVKQEEEQLLPLSCSEYTGCVKIEEDCSLQRQSQTVHKEEKPGEDTSALPHCHSVITQRQIKYFSSDTDNDEDWELPFSCSSAKLETEKKGDHDNLVQIRNPIAASLDSSLPIMDKSSLQTSTAVNYGDLSGSAKEVEMTKHHCPVCTKSFGSEPKLQNHISVHTRTRRFMCSVCKSSFLHMSHLRVHMRIHTGERPYSCTVCKKSFYQNWNLQAHMRSHTGDKRYSCATCQKAFVHKCALKVHMRIHSGERPYSCSVCGKTFAQNSNLQTHMKNHTL